MRWPGNTLTVISTVPISDTAQEEDDREPSQQPAGAPQKLPCDCLWTPIEGDSSCLLFQVVESGERERLVYRNGLVCWEWP